MLACVHKVTTICYMDHKKLTYSDIYVLPLHFYHIVIRKVDVQVIDERNLLLRTARKGESVIIYEKIACVPEISKGISARNIL